MKTESIPRSNRIHIGIFGKTNSGKSSLINAITLQDTALVSKVAGTTTDPVMKNMEITGLGACVLVDTAGFNDISELGKLRIKKTQNIIKRCDIALLVCTDNNTDQEISWIEVFKKYNIPVLLVVNKIDSLKIVPQAIKKISQQYSLPMISVSATNNIGISDLRYKIVELLKDDIFDTTIIGNLVKEDDTVLLIMPQDSEAPKGRLILPQVQTIRELLDRKCITICSTTKKMEQSLQNLVHAPKLIITDSQVFKYVYDRTPKESMLTSFSVLFANYKGDVKTFIQGASQIDLLTEDSKILISEACTHAPLTEDIGTVKIPALLRKKIGPNLTIDHISGNDFPDDLSSYDLIIHCAGCMFNRKHMINRIIQAKGQNVPITNYGITIAYLNHILDKIVYPK